MRCKIIIPVWNQLQMTKQCLESIILKTRAPYEILLIDNGSKQETASYLRDFASRYKDKVRLIRNKINLGFVKAANQGLRISEADLVCLLNNDTLVTEGWLDELISVASSDDKIGLLNPSSNTLGQKTNIKDIDNYCRTLKKDHGQFEEMAQVSGFCMLIKREAIETIGLFDEVYGMGFFEDTDYSRRAKEAGFKSVRVLASYVYHYENMSFLRFKRRNATFKRNQEIFYKRWGKPKRIFVEARYDLGSKEMDKFLSFARSGNWVIITKEKDASLKALRHSNVKIVDNRKFLFLLMCLFRILKKVKKRYNILVVQSRSLRKILKFLRPIHKAKIFSLDELGSLNL